MGKNKLIVPIITGVIITLTLFFTIIIKSKTPFELNLLLAYTGIGVIGFGYSAALQKLKMALASYLFLVFVIISGITFYVSMPGSSEALSQLASFLGWLLFMVISIVLSLIVGIIFRIRNKRLP